MLFEFVCRVCLSVVVKVKSVYILLFKIYYECLEAVYIERVYFDEFIL